MEVLGLWSALTTITDNHDWWAGVNRLSDVGLDRCRAVHSPLAGVMGNNQLGWPQIDILCHVLWLQHMYNIVSPGQGLCVAL